MHAASHKFVAICYTTEAYAAATAETKSKCKISKNCQKLQKLNFHRKNMFLQFVRTGI